ncbi:hypothetical protein ACOME3_010325 [Neoechinorhynchus agilis]
MTQTSNKGKRQVSSKSISGFKRDEIQRPLVYCYNEVDDEETASTLSARSHGSLQAIEKMLISDVMEMPTEEFDHILDGNEMNTRMINTLLPDFHQCCSEDWKRHLKSLDSCMQGTGRDVDDIVQNNKAFRNPTIYEKIISHLSIREHDTNTTHGFIGPYEWQKESFYEELRKMQEEEMSLCKKKKAAKLGIKHVDHK